MIIFFPSVMLFFSLRFGEFLVSHPVLCRVVGPFPPPPGKLHGLVSPLQVAAVSPFRAYLISVRPGGFFCSPSVGLSGRSTFTASYLYPCNVILSYPFVGSFCTCPGLSFFFFGYVGMFSQCSYCGYPWRFKRPRDSVTKAVRSFFRFSLR